MIILSIVNCVLEAESEDRALVFNHSLGNIVLSYLHGTRNTFQFLINTIKRGLTGMGLAYRFLTQQ